MIFMGVVMYAVFCLLLKANDICSQFGMEFSGLPVFIPAVVIVDPVSNV